MSTVKITIAVDAVPKNIWLLSRWSRKYTLMGLAELIEHSRRCEDEEPYQEDECQ